MYRHIFTIFIFCSLAWPYGAAMAEESAAQPSSAAETQPSGFYRISVKDAEEAVAAALVQKGVAEKVSTMVIGKRGGDLYQSNKPLQVRVKTLDFDKVTGKWSANVFFESEGNVLSAIPLAGRFEEVIEVPTLKRRMQSGEVIKAEDVETIDIPASKMRRDTVISQKELLGKTPRRVVSASRPIRQDEVITPVILQKGSVVEMQYRGNGIEIKTMGEALDSGSEGDMVRVRNQDSKLVVRGVVESGGKVRILTAGQVAEAGKELSYATP